MNITRCLNPELIFNGNFFQNLTVCSDHKRYKVKSKQKFNFKEVVKGQWEIL